MPIIYFLTKYRSFAKQSYMKKIYLFVTLLLAVLLLQNCKKDTVTETATSNNLFFADINDSTWNADTVNASITYNSATKNKVFTCSGIALNKEVNMSVTLSNALNTAGFPLSTYNVNTTSITMSYDIEQKNAMGAYVLTPQGVVAAGSGSVIITAIDSVKKVMTGTFSCTTLQNNPDNTVTINQVSAGAFNNMPYTFVSN